MGGGRQRGPSTHQSCKHEIRTGGLVSTDSESHLSLVLQQNVLNVKVLVGTFNQEKALVGAFSVIAELQTSQRLVSSSTPSPPSRLDMWAGRDLPPPRVRVTSSDRRRVLGHMESVNIQQHLKACVPHNLDNIEISRRFVTWSMVSNIDIYSMKKYLLYSTRYT